MVFFKRLAMLIICLSLTACAWLNEHTLHLHNHDDRTVAPGVTLQQPAGLPAASRHSVYDIPEAHSSRPQTKPALVHHKQSVDTQTVQQVRWSEAEPAGRLVLLQARKPAWYKLAAVLKQFGYPVVQRDRGLRSFFIRRHLPAQPYAYQLHLQTLGPQEIQVVVMDKFNRKMSAKKTRQILKTLYRHIEAYEATHG